MANSQRDQHSDDVTTGSHSGIITLKKTEEKPAQETFTVTSGTNVCNDGEHGDDAGELGAPELRPGEGTGWSAVPEAGAVHEAVRAAFVGRD